MEISLEQYESLAPLSAHIESKSAEERKAALIKFSTLNNAIKQTLVGTETVEWIFELSASGLLPLTHQKAFSKLLGFILLDGIPATESAALLQKLGIPPEKALQLSSALQERIAPGIALNEETEGELMRELPPLTQRIPEKPSAGPRNASRNIIDLRNQS